MNFKQEDIYYLVSKELGIPQEQVEFVVKDFFSNLRWFMRETKKPILINSFIKFSFKQDRYDKVIKQRELKNNEKDTSTQEDN